jgi:hypothetical protein
MDEMPESAAADPATPKFDPVEFAASKPLATPRELAIAFGQLIDSICDLTQSAVSRIVTPSLSAVTVSWEMKTVPSADWLKDVEAQLASFAACAGVQVRFRRH